MTAAPPAREAVRDHLIVKGGFYYRPNRSGYTASWIEAGRYTETEAKREAAIEPWHMQAVPVQQALDGRRSIDYAIEFGEYLANAADALLDVMGETPARDDCADAMQALRSAVYEFRKRRQRILTGAPDA